MIVEVELDGEDPRRYRLERRDDRYLVELLDTDDDGHAVRHWRVDLRSPEDGVYSLLIDDLSFEVFVEEAEDAGDRMSVHLLNRTFDARAADARRPKLAALQEGADGVGRITAPIPGRIVEILTPEGADVRRGEGVIVLEAMKMENELKAPRDGTVTSIEVTEGQGVEGGALLATVE